MKIKMQNYGTEFYLHCPRCGNGEFSIEIYNSGTNIYHKCLHCGSDVCTDEHTRIGIVIEKPFYEFTEHTYDLIAKEIVPREYGWKDGRDAP